MSDHETASFFQRLKKGLEDSISYSREELSLRTTKAPAPPPPVGRAQVIALRKRLRMSQSVFAATLNVSTKLVQGWEQGLRKPDRGELRLIEIIAKRPEIVAGLLPGRPSLTPTATSRKRAATAA